ncbi:magnesium/cobalt transporter CorA [Marininema halotolerans]|uniref:Magnesium transport protein CorA n=1 Tax=Marininema halotolerans TaxID=1155944 RepID=A0A1I6S6V7_9BACL|nr:magnesium/cobalt transporter CorA [Marininema halotolerans]SFS72508.1 magnesium transporter [Marininema halotolerans]
MVYTYAVTQDGEALHDIQLSQLKEDHIQWYWVDFAKPSADETQLLADFFDFHPLAIEDCLHRLQRPKMDYYHDHVFLIVHDVHPDTLEPEEVNLFVGENFIVTFHLHGSEELAETRARVWREKDPSVLNPSVIAHRIMDKIVDTLFPVIHKIEDRLDELDSRQEVSTPELIDEVFDIRSELIRLRHSVIPMRDLLYRIINSRRFMQNDERRFYFSDIHDHLVKLAHMIDSNREMTADIRDSYLSLNSFRMNRIMKTLTVITVIFMPLTFLAGVYGMNFVYMPELHNREGYFIVLGVMVLLALSLTLWFKSKGWFN